MLKLTRIVKEHFLTLTKVVIHQIAFISWPIYTFNVIEFK